ncbi:MAG: hypothetical protein K2X82_26750 [Gemmataceae bacterium]|nr:hypothetical protein [Gemmataceae bacterium]
MTLPPFGPDGDLPPGVYPATLAEALDRFGGGTPRRQVAARRLDHIYHLAASTGHVVRFVVFGSFVTAEPNPRDIDIVLVMDDRFDVSALPRTTAVVFNHAEADALLGASVFWATRSGAFGGEQAMVEYWQVRRGGGLRGIIEIVPGSP